MATARNCEGEDAAPEAKQDGQETESAREDNRERPYDDFFSGFRVGSAAAFFPAFDENFPVCGGFDFPRILILLVAIGSLPFLEQSYAEFTR